MRYERGFALMLFGAMAIPTVALVGLAIDTGVLYLIKSKLSAAVDAGSLAGARALSRGNDDTAQRTRAQQVAMAYVRANFPQGYLMSGTLNIPTPTVDASVANQRSVAVSATVQAPVFFMRILGAAGSSVRAAATAIRRDVNVMLVLDRSGSLQTSNSCDELRAAATGFVQKFAPGRDNLGMVTFGTSSFTEFPIGSNFASANPTLEGRIGSIVCNGGTSAAAGLSRGYYELAGLNEPAALNVILFFTDGQPTAVHANFNIVGTACGAAARPTLPGVWTADANATSIWGLMSPDNGYSPVSNDNRVAPYSNGCSFANSWSANHAVTSDYSHVPRYDIWGNDLDSGYRSIPSRDAMGRIRHDRPANVSPAATNAADNAAFRIRSGASINGRSLVNVVVFGIGLGNVAGAAEDAFMLRVTNDRASANYNSNQREGLYVYAPTAADLDDAFTRLASEILRLAQ